jgi:hypothetical protein
MGGQFSEEVDLCSWKGLIDSIPSSQGWKMPIPCLIDPAFET